MSYKRAVIDIVYSKGWLHGVWKRKKDVLRKKLGAVVLDNDELEVVDGDVFNVFGFL